MKFCLGHQLLLYVFMFVQGFQLPILCLLGYLHALGQCIQRLYLPIAQYIQCT